MEREGSVPPESRSFASLGLIQKHRAVEKVLDEKVRPELIKDGGNLEVVDMKGEGGNTEVYVKYTGACKGCPSAQMGTLDFIEEFLRKELDQNIRVLPV